MATDRSHAAIRQIGTLFDVGTMGSLADPDLLDRFLDRDGEAAELAFAALVERHGPMVLRVCVGVLADLDDAQDAFQATFLVLATRARTLRRRDSLASWLHGVALRVARCARSASMRRRSHERRLGEAAATAFEVDPDDLGPVVREEFGRLPERDRAPILLCDLEGLTHEQAAGRLGWPVGTVKSRLARGRARLRDRLTRRGLAPSAALPVLAGRTGWMTTLPSGSAEALARTAVRVATGTPTTGAVPASIDSLLQGVRRTMIRTSIRNAILGASALGLLAAGMAFADAERTDPAIAPAPEATDDLPGKTGRWIAYQAWSMVMNGLDWRDAAGAGLRKVRTGGPFGVWTADARVLTEMIRRAGKVTQFPRVTSAEDIHVVLNHQEERHYVAAVKWVDDGANKACAAVPEVAQVADGFTMHLRARKLDQGILIRAEVEDQHLLGLKTVPVESPPGKSVRLVSQKQIPETTQLRDGGEWLVPEDGLLILSLGSWHAGPTSPRPEWVEALIRATATLWYGAEAWEEKQYWSGTVCERLIVVDARSLLEPAAPSPAPPGPLIPQPLPARDRKPGS